MAIQNLISSAVNSADVIMLGYIGQTAIAASSLAGNVAFILFMVSTGLSSGLVMLGAQYWGKKDTESIKTLPTHSHADFYKGSGVDCRRL